MKGDQIHEAGTFVVSINGVSFRLWRRSTFLMARARGIGKTLGIIHGANEAKRKGEDGKVSFDLDEYSGLVESVVRVALVDPYVVSDGEEPAPPRSYTFDQIAPFADALFESFMKSGVEVDPMPPS